MDEYKPLVGVGPRGGAHDAGCDGSSSGGGGGGGGGERQGLTIARFLAQRKQLMWNTFGALWNTFGMVSCNAVTKTD